MKKRLCFWVLAVLVVLSCVSAVSAAENEIVLVQDGEVPVKIVVAQEALPGERFAAKELQKLFSAFTGTDVIIVRDTDRYNGPFIAIGQTNRMSFDLSEKPENSYVIVAAEKGLCICGTGGSGNLDGVYRFLEDYCGYYVFEQGVCSKPVIKDLSVPADLKIEYEPFFEYRKLDTRSTNYSEFCRAHSLNGCSARSGETGVYVPFLGRYGHTLSTIFCSKDIYFDSHPEYFALRKGERVPDQLCLTNKEVLKIVTDEVLDLLQREYDPNGSLQVVSLTQDDNKNYCTCENCARVDNENGSQAGTMIGFVNAVAEKVKQAGYDKAVVDTFAYQYTRKPPTQVKPLDNVVVRLCSIECCNFHTLDDKKCEENVSFMKDLNAWQKICKRLYVYDYVNNFSETFEFYPDFNTLQRNVQIFYENNVRGLYESGNYYMNICDGEFHELRTYLLAELMEDPYRTDFDILMKNYLTAVYGPGGEDLQQVIELLCSKEVNRDDHLHIRQQPNALFRGLKAKQVTQIDTLWAHAKAAAENGEQWSRIDKSEICWEHWKACHYKKAYSIWHTPKDFIKARLSLLEKIQKYGNIAVGEGEIKYLSTHPARVYFFAPTYWETKFDGSLFDKFDGLAEWIYNRIFN